MRLVTSEQLEECLQIQRRLSEMGVNETLGELLVKKGYLSKEQVSQVLAKMGIDVHIIPQYRLIARLGRGGMGAVYKALHVSMNRVVALKILDREATTSKTYVERFLREARQAAQLSHPNIVRAFDAGQANGLYYFAMEYIAGETVHRQVKQEGPYSEKKAIDVLRQIADALGYISKRGLVHRDVKPENILVDRRGRAYLCDFGLAKSMVDGTLTRSGFTFGTPYYMSPEQISGKHSLDIRSDLYSLGACLHFMVTGRPPFEAANLQAILSKHLTDRPPSPKVANPAVSEGLCSVYYKLMEKDPENRYPNARELVVDLRRVSAGLAARAGGRRRGLSRALAACAMLILTAAAVAGGVVLFRDDRKPPRSPSEPVASGVQPKAEAAWPPEPSAAQSLREERERQALAHFVAADKAFQEGNWALACSTYEKIDTDFNDTDLFRENRRLIFERAAYCRAQTELLADASTQQLSEKHKRARGLYEQAFLRMNAGNWGDAIVLFQQLLDADVPEVVSATRLQQLIEHCQGEQRALAEWQKIQDAASAKAWDRVLAEGARFRSENRASQTLAAVAADLDGHEKRARREIQASGKLNEILASFENRAWGTFREQVAAFLDAYSDTDTAQTARERLLAKVAESRTAEREPFEKAAEALFHEAVRDLAAKNHAAAKSKFERLQAEHAGTELVAQKRPEIDKALAEIAKAELAQREKEFQRRYRELVGLFHRKKYDEAIKSFDGLMAEYPEREFWDSKQKELETFLERAEQEIHREKYVIRQDFEDGPSGWTAEGPGEPRIDRSDNHVGGQRGARVHFEGFPEPNEWARVWRRIDKGLSPQIKSISFMACSADRNVITILPFLMTRVGGKEYFYMVERQIGGAWSKVRIAVFEFRPIQGQETPPKLDLQDVRGFGFAHPGRTMTRTFFLDDIESEFK